MSPRLKELLASLIIIAFYVISFFTPEWTHFIIYLTLTLGIIYHGQLLGKYFFPKSAWVLSTYFGIICYFAVQCLIQVIWFHLGQVLTKQTDMVTVPLSMLTCYFLTLFSKVGDEILTSPAKDWSPRKILISFLISASSLAASAFVVISSFRAATLDSIRTPWPLLPPGMIAAAGLTWLAVILAAWGGKSRGLTVFQSIIAIFTTTAIAPLIYRLGFGFDGFLHVAAQKVLLATGTLTPKPLYYMGQYVFETWLARSAQLSLEPIDRWLVPVTAALLIPLSMAVSREDGKKSSLLFFLFLLPLGAFVSTTPQSLAYILCLVSIILTKGFGSGQAKPLGAFLLSAWAITIHPLAGIPVFFVVAGLALLNPAYDRFLKIRITISHLLGIAGAASVPALFYFMSNKSATAMNWNLSSIFSLEPWQELFSLFVPFLQNSFVAFPAWATLSLKALPFLLLAAAIINIFIQPKNEKPAVILLTVSALLLFISGAMLKSAGDFAFLIDYERGNYADRLYIIALLCLLPAAWPGLAHILDTARQKQPVLAIFLVLGCLCFAGAETYNALPRHDALVIGRGWSVGQADVTAVKAIDRDAAGADYTVLANQSVSAAAVSQFGFKRYAGDVFFYPIPTGGPLYELFLNMTYKEPSRETAAEAGKLGKSKLVYVVLNDYWWNAPQVAEQISAIANQEWQFGNPALGAGHAVNVYKFVVNK